MSNEEAYCPYCGKAQEINHDDGYGYAEDDVFCQTCGDCDKVFSYTTTIHFHHQSMKAPCLNGGEHVYTRIFRYGSKGREAYDQCIHCDHIKEES